MEISAAMVKDLRERTGAGMMQCKKALGEAGGDIEAAAEILRKLGLSSLAKRAERSVSEGRIEAYVHPGNRIAVLVEVNCETDFVARTDDFLRLCRELALQVAATAPRWIAESDIPAEEIEAQKKQIHDRLAGDGLKGAELDERASKEVDRFLEETVLLRQPGIRDGSKVVGEMVTDVAAKLGENIKVSRFSYYRLGGNP